MFQILGILCPYFYTQSITTGEFYIHMKVKFALQ